MGSDTTRCHAEETLDQSERLCGLALQAAQGGAWHWDLLHDEASGWSPEMFELWGLPPGTLPRRAEMLARLDERDRERIRQITHDAVARRSPYQYEYRIHHPTRGERWLCSHGRAFYDDSGRPVRLAGITLDITERKQAELAIAQARDELEAQVKERNAALRESVAQLESFSYSLTHDLRAPLRAMTSFAALLKQECAGKLAPDADDYIRRIQDAAARMDHLIVDVLQYAQLQRADLPVGSVEIPKLIHDIIQQYPDIAVHREHIHFETACAGACPRANLAALTQVLSNLLANAIKFVPPGRTPDVRVRCEPRDGFVRLSVQDNGVGIAPEHRDRIWGIFQRLHGAEYPGTGIGLSIVKQGVERMGGRLGLDSEVGRGSCFWIELPQAAPNAP